MPEEWIKAKEGGKKIKGKRVGPRSNLQEPRQGNMKGMAGGTRNRT